MVANTDFQVSVSKTHSLRNRSYDDVVGQCRYETTCAQRHEQFLLSDESVTMGGVNTA